MGSYEIKPKDFNESAFKVIGDDWMLITAGNEEDCNTMTASWGTFGIMWNKNIVSVVLRPQRYTKEFVDENERFSLTVFDKKYKKDLGYLGSVSGRDEKDKISKTSLTLDFIDSVPTFKEARITIIAKKLFVQRFEEDSFLDKTLMEKNYPNKDYHYMYFAEVEKIIISDEE